LGRSSLFGARISSGSNGNNGSGAAAIRVLVAEDDDVCRKLLSRQLLALGAEVIHEVDNGLEAMRAIRRQNFTHVFLDLCMPCIDGFTLILEIQDTCAVMNKPLPTICIITAHEDPEVLKKCRDTGVKQVMVKPIKTKDLEKVLRPHHHYSEPRGGGGLFSESNGGFESLMAGLRATGGATLDQVDDAKQLYRFTRRSYDGSRVNASTPNLLVAEEIAGGISGGGGGSSGEAAVANGIGGEDETAAAAATLHHAASAGALHRRSNDGPAGGAQAHGFENGPAAMAMTSGLFG